MRILFDQGTPIPLKHHLPGHEIQSAFELGWSKLTNGELLAAAEGRFDVFVTTDRNLRYQQSLTGRKLAIPCASDNQLAAIAEPHGCDRHGRCRDTTGRASTAPALRRGRQN
jgi:hypothetical protein